MTAPLPRRLRLRALLRAHAGPFARLAPIGVVLGALVARLVVGPSPILSSRVLVVFGAYIVAVTALVFVLFHAGRAAAQADREQDAIDNAEPIVLPFRRRAH